MTKREFLDTLGMQLQGELSREQIEGHIHYYREYIEEAVAAGRPESEVLEELGSPVLIARTLLDAARASGTYRPEGGTYYREETYESSEDPWEESVEDGRGRHVHVWNVNPRALKIIAAVVLCLFLFLLFSLMGSLLVFVIRYFVPIVLICVLIGFFRRR